MHLQSNEDADQYLVKQPGKVCAQMVVNASGSPNMVLPCLLFFEVA